jgi:hypothetical protein
MSRIKSNPIAADLRSGKYSKKVVADKKKKISKKACRVNAKLTRQD